MDNLIDQIYNLSKASWDMGIPYKDYTNAMKRAGIRPSKRYMEDVLEEKTKEELKNIIKELKNLIKSFQK